MGTGRYRIDPIIDKEFRRNARAAHGDDFIKGHYMEEANKAFAMYNASKRNESTTTQYTSSTQRITKQEVIEVKNKIIEWMLTPGSNPNKSGTALYECEGDPKCIVERHLKEAIKIVTSKVDKRTVDNWIKRLEVNECIKWFGPHTYEFLTNGVKEEIQKENKQQTPIPKHKNIDAEKEANDVISRFI